MKLCFADLWLLTGHAHGALDGTGRAKPLSIDAVLEGGSDDEDSDAEEGHGVADDRACEGVHDANSRLHEA